jgi:hypothetical protein
MSDSGKHRVTWAEYRDLQGEIAGITRRIGDIKDVEGGSGWGGDRASRAAIQAMIEPLVARREALEARLARMIPVDADDLFPYAIGAPNAVDEILAAALRDTALFRFEVWQDGRALRRVPMPPGPVIASAVAAALRDDGVAGQLRLIRQSLASGSPEEVVYLANLADEAQPVAAPQPATTGAITLEQGREGWRFVFAADGEERVASDLLPCGDRHPTLARDACRPLLDLLVADLRLDGWVPQAPAAGDAWFTVRLRR